MKNNKKAFTLIELLLVISIVALLSSIILSQMQESRNKAKIANIQQNLTSLRNEIELYRSNTGVYVNGVGLTGDCAEDAQFGALGTFSADRIIDEIEAQAGKRPKCGINKDSWAISIDISNLAKNENGIVEKVYADSISLMCADSSGNVYINLEGIPDNGSGNDDTTLGFTIIESTQKYICNI